MPVLITSFVYPCTTGECAGPCDYCAILGGPRDGGQVGGEVGGGEGGPEGRHGPRAAKPEG